jgi:hypothetical protein
MLASDFEGLPSTQHAIGPPALATQQVASDYEQGQEANANTPTKHLMARWRQSTAVAVEGISRLERELQEARAEIEMLRKQQELTQQPYLAKGAPLDLVALAASPTALQGGEWGGSSTPVRIHSYVLKTKASHFEYFTFVPGFAAKEALSRRDGSIAAWRRCPKPKFSTYEPSKLVCKPVSHSW